MATAKTITLAQFEGGGVRKTGLTAWLRGLPINKPVAFPRELTSSSEPARTIHPVARANQIKVSTKTIDGVLYVVRRENGTS